MIQASDLRIGNLVGDADYIANAAEYDEITVLIVNGDENTISSAYADTISCDELYGIPLTKEWLERCGRKCENGNGWEYQIQVGALKWYFRWNTEWYSEVGGIYIDSRVQYIHQLQNLYFALTGKEIEIKEPSQK